MTAFAGRYNQSQATLSTSEPGEPRAEPIRARGRHPAPVARQCGASVPTGLIADRDRFAYVSSLGLNMH